MIKFIIALSITIGGVFALADDCNYYGRQAIYFQEKVKQDTNSLKEYQTTSKWCQLADDLEQTLNYLGLVKKTCINGYEVNDVIKEMAPLLMRATMKCGH